MSATTTTVSDARRDFADIFNRVAYGRERVIIERHGKGRVAVVPIEDLAVLELVEDRLDLLAADAALKEAEQQGSVAWQELREEVER
jgi:prevent-host-death family protein